MSSATPARGERWTGIASILMALIGWSSIPLFLKHFSHLIDPWTSNGWRYGFSAIFWSPVIVLGLSRRSLPRGIWVAALWPSLFNCVAQTVFCLAHYKIDPGLLTFGLRSNIVFTTIGAAALFAAERRIIRLPGFIAGVLLVIGGTTGTILLGDDVPKGATLAGVMLAITAGAGFAAYALAVRRCVHGMNAIQAFAVISLYTALGMVVMMLLWGERFGAPALRLIGQPLGSRPSGVFPFDQFGMLMLSAMIGIALGHVAYYYAIARLGVAVSSGVVQLQPFFVSIASLAIFGEQLTRMQWASGSVAVLGAVLILLVQHIQRRPQVALVHAPAPLEYAELPPDHVAAATAAECEQP